MVESRYWFAVAAAVLAVVATRPCFADEGATLEGQLVDAVSGEPVGWAVVILDERDHHAHADAEGRFRLEHLPAGLHTVQVLRIGYSPGGWTVNTPAGAVTEVTLRLVSRSVTLHESVVTADRSNDAVSALAAPEQVIGDQRLRQNLSRTIAETIALEPGLAQRSMGPAPARPVLRGLSGDRLLVLEDGGRTGDLSATSSDHAVAIEPLTTERIEIVRGPEAILYGGNALGGVVNVVRGAVPSERVERPRGAISWQLESVNSGIGSGIDVHLPAGPLVFRLDGSLRGAGDIGTPDGDLLNTDLTTGNTALGIGWVRPWGHVGIGYSLYDSDYGIPPDPIGGHPSGVDIRLDRRHREVRVGLHPPTWTWLRRLELIYAHSHYFQEEIEASGDIGLEFGVLTTNTEVRARLAPIGPLRNVTLGLWGEHRDYNTAGLVFTPDAEETAGAAFIYGEWLHGPWSTNAALRWDGRRLDPAVEKISDEVGHIRERSFAGASGGIGVERQLGSALRSGVTWMSSFRAPQVEEVYSEGPHLAAYAFEVGNADIGEEQGNGLELFVDWRGAAGDARLAVFRNTITGYIFPQNTGQLSLRRGDLLLYRFTGLDAQMWGAEAGWQLHLTRRLSSYGTVSLVHGELDEGDDLPSMPPLQGRIGVRYQAATSFDLGGALRFADDQNRPGRFEAPTSGYVVLDLSAEMHKVAFGLLHVMTLSVDNALDTEYRRHLNRVREIMPEPGRSVRVLHKAFF